MKKWIKAIILASVGGLLLIGGLLSWNLYFSKFKIFYDQEKLFLETVERYYSMNQHFLPKTGETREVTLQDMYDGGHIGDLYIPKTKKLCDSDNSWVRVYKNNNDEYEYTTYLKCGKFESNVDHIGPEVVLNGDSLIYLSLGSNYEELGVKSVVDDTDGEIDTSNVTIDNSKVNTSKVGSYKVTYTIRDSSYNKTVVTREVVVAQNLTEVVKEATDDTNYYRGNVENNYLLFSGMLWRIVNVNDDGSIKIISDEAVTNLRANHSIYEDSNIDTWLKNVFYESLHNPDEYLIDTTYCVGNITSIYDYSTECDTVINSKIGLLSIGDYAKTLVGEENSIFSTSFMLANKIGDNYAEVPYDSYNINGVSTGNLAPIRPVVTLKSNLYLISGNGSEENPYKLDDYSYGKENDKLNTRLIGEYLEYSGLVFRIIGIDSNENIRVIMDKPWMVQPGNQKLTVSVKNVDSWVFNLSDENNPGYVLNNDYYHNYIDTTSIVDTEYEIPINVANLKYDQYEVKSIKAKILLPKTYELFSASGNNAINRNTSFIYIDQSTNDQLLFMVNGVTGKMFELNKDQFTSYSVKAVLTLKSSLKIASGNGTKNDPYSVK